MVAVAEPKPVSPYDLVAAYNVKKGELYSETLRDINAFLYTNMERIIKDGSIRYEKDLSEAHRFLAVDIHRDYTDIGWVVEFDGAFLVFKLPGLLIGD